MQIEVLYFDGCPNHRPLVELIQAVLKEEGASAQVLEINVADDAQAKRLSFLGSPSVRINGLDVEPALRASQNFGMMCRTYLVGNQFEGVPPREMIRQAVREAQGALSTASSGSQPTLRSAAAGEKPKSASILVAGPALAAIVASLCCTLPIVFALTGFSILGASAFFESMRPYMLALTFGLLGLGFYYAYRPRRQEVCVPGSACAVPAGRRGKRVMLLLVTLASVAFAAFPYYSGPAARLVLGSRLATNPEVREFAGTLRPSDNPTAQEALATIKVPKMDCEACAVAVRQALANTKGIKSANIDVDQRLVTVAYEGLEVTVAQIREVIQNTGFEVE